VLPTEPLLGRGIRAKRGMATADRFLVILNCDFHRQGLRLAEDLTQ
jgi:hypothetical protein